MGLELIVIQAAQTKEAIELESKVTCTLVQRKVVLRKGKSCVS